MIKDSNSVLPGKFFRCVVLITQENGIAVKQLKKIHVTYLTGQHSSIYPITILHLFFFPEFVMLISSELLGILDVSY